MSARRTPARLLLAFAIIGMVVAVIGFIGSLVLSTFFDDYNAYGEVPIPGEQSLHLPAGQVNITFHTVLVGGSNGNGLVIPPLGLDFVPPEGVAQPEVTESFGTSTTVNNDARRRVWVAQIPVEGDYLVKTDGKVTAFLDPRLAFGKGGSSGPWIWVFVGLFVVSLLDLIVAVVWSSRVKRAGGSAISAAPPALTFDYPTVTTPPADPYAPTGDGVRTEQLKTLAALRDSGALTQQEFEAEKRRVLDDR
jgi:hypothetical protein